MTDTGRPTDLTEYEARQFTDRIRRAAGELVVAGGDAGVVLAEFGAAVEWADRIKGHLGRAVEGIVAAGRELTAARAALDHGLFERMVRDLLGMDPSTARRFMAIAQHPILSNRAHAHDLPTSWMTLYELTKAPDEALETALEHGVITPATTRSEVTHLAAVVDRVRDAISQVEAEPVAPEQVGEIVRAVVEKERARIVQARQDAAEIAALNEQFDPGPDFDWEHDKEMLREGGAILRITQELVGFRAPADVAAAHRTDLSVTAVATIRRARDWLDGLLAALEA